MNGARSIAAVGDVSNPNTWSGIPFHFWQAAREMEFASTAWRVDLSRASWQRIVWNAGQVLRGRTGGFQYSKWFLDLLESQVPRELMGSEIVSFNQHFPRASSVAIAGGSLNHYLDAPFAALSAGRGLDLRLPRPVIERAIEDERENYAASRRVVTMARWASEVLIKECGVPAAKVHVILPGANLKLPDNWKFPTPAGRAGKERDFVLGFVGKDWRRKGLSLVISVRDELARRGWRTRVLAAGDAPPELQRRKGVEFVGFIDKPIDPSTFLRFLSSCDVGCLLSEREALGISILEFLRAGVPVAGFAYEGTADTLPPDAGFRFEREASVDVIADIFDGYLQDEIRQADFRANAQQWSPLVTWERCVREFNELWRTDTVRNPVRLWLGLPKVSR